MKNLLLSFLILVGFVFTTNIYSQIVSNGTGGGVWSATTTWAGGVVPGSANDVVITGTDVVQITVTASAKNITINNGATLKSNTTVGSPITLRVYGATITVNGTLGDPTNGDAIRIEYANAGEVTTITGSGTTGISMIRAYQTGTATGFTFDMDVKLFYASIALQTYRDGETYTINSGKTVTLTAGSLGVGSGSTAAAYGTTYNISGTLDLSAGGNAYLKTSSSKAVAFNILSGGVAKIGGSFNLTNSTDGGSASLTVNNGGSLQLGGSVDFGVATLTMNGTLTYNGTSAQNTGALPSSLNNLVINNSAGVTLNNTVTISNMFSIASGAFVDLGSNNHTSQYLQLGGADQTAGTYGSTASLAANQNSTYFGTTATGILTVNSAVPVELTSFIATRNGENVLLNWETATEVQNYGFNLERKAANGNWIIISFIQGHGNSNSPKRYAFTDNNPVGANKFYYRLKQIDTDGGYEYSNIIEVNMTPSEYKLAQNYPNPFNPSTNIDYSLPMDSKVTLAIYSLIGEKVADLVNEEQASGYYSYQFGSRGLNLTSGVYLYKLTAVSKLNEVFSQSKKMLLLK